MSIDDGAGRRVRADGERSRHAILDAAVDLATVEGLSGLSLARLATVTGMSKSGVFGLFGSKEDLQIAVVDRARDVFIHEVVLPALELPPGRDRLAALCVGYLDHVQRRVFAGGCFFAAVASEVSTRPGPVRDRVVAEHTAWTRLLAESAEQAVERGEVAGDPDAQQLTYALSTLLTGADIAYLLRDDPGVLDAARAEIETRLRPR